MYERMKVCDPLFLQLDDPRAPRLLFTVVEDPPQRGTIEQLSPGATAQHFDWFTEMLLQLQDRSGAPMPARLCVYRIPIDEQVDLHAACIDVAPELMMSMLGGADYGDNLSLLIRKHWPDVYSMLEASTAGDLSRRVILAFDTRHGRQWLVADPVVGDARGWFHPDQVGALAVDALEIALRVNEILTRLPEILELGPDLASRRLAAWGGLLSGVGGAGSGAMDLASEGFKPDAIADIIEAMKGLPDQLRGVGERRSP
jgi:hypothetical protein